MERPIESNNLEPEIIKDGDHTRIIFRRPKTSNNETSANGDFDQKEILAATESDVSDDRVTAESVTPEIIDVHPRSTEVKPAHLDYMKEVYSSILGVKVDDFLVSSLKRGKQGRIVYDPALITEEKRDAMTVLEQLYACDIVSLKNMPESIREFDDWENIQINLKAGIFIAEALKYQGVSDEVREKLLAINDYIIIALRTKEAIGKNVGGLNEIERVLNPEGLITSRERFERYIPEQE